MNVLQLNSRGGEIEAEPCNNDYLFMVFTILKQYKFYDLYIFQFLNRLRALRFKKGQILKNDIFNGSRVASTGASLSLNPHNHPTDSSP